MARLFRVNTAHLIERAIERCGSEAQPAVLAMIQSLEKAITEGIPDDWRFTVNPHGKFIIACGEKFEFRYVGRSWREKNRRGQALVERLSAETVSRDSLKESAKEYLSLVRTPDCDIYHEIKTCYGRTQDLSEEKDLFNAVKKMLKHVVLVDEKRVASRPNALLADGEIWARQGEWFDISVPAGQYCEQLLFVRLTPEGPDWSRTRLYRLDQQGNLRLVKERSDEPRPHRTPPCGVSGRGQSYWMLPTYPDAVRMDCRYRLDNWRGDGKYRLSPERMLLLARLDALCRMVKGKKSQACSDKPAPGPKGR